MDASRRRWAGTAAEAFAAERDRWALWIPVAMAAGIAVYFSLPHEPPLWAGVLGMSAATVAAALLRNRTAAFVAAVAVAAMATGFAAAEWRARSVAAPVIERELGPVSVTARVTVVEQRPSDRRLTLTDLELPGLMPDQVPETVRLVVRARDGAVKPGDRVRLRAVLLPPSPPVAPGAFDFARQAWFQRLGGVGYAVSAPEVVVAAAPGAFAAGMDSLRHGISERITSRLPGQPGAVAAALMTGDRGGIDDEAWASLRDSGLAHLLAISGLHVGLVAGILFAALRAALAAWESVALRFPIKKWAAAAGMAGALGYLALTGGTIPTQRAVLMLGFVLLAVMLDRRPISMRLVAWAAAAVLLVAPDSLLGPSFQMSFAAVVALVAAYELLREPFGRWRRGGISLRRRIAAVRRRRRRDDRGRRSGDDAVCALPLQPSRGVQRGGERPGGAGRGDVDHAVGDAGLCPDAPGPRRSGVGADGMGNLVRPGSRSHGRGMARGGVYAANAADGRAGAGQSGRPLDVPVAAPLAAGGTAADLLGPGLDRHGAAARRAGQRRRNLFCGAAR
ncbi:MAG: ComEC/Rec2 family competence protein [Proteobacteria bacterium]|nr:ComEC/Rec2 family competence protein [Pseudomonadota bacterium]